MRLDEAKIRERGWVYLVCLATASAFTSGVANLPTWPAWILGSIRDLSLTLTVVLLLTLGIRHVRRSGYSLATLAYPAGGALLGVALLVTMVTTYSSLASTLVLLDGDKSVLRQAERVLSDPSSPPALRTIVSKSRAREKYLYRGVVVTFQTELNGAHEFEPSHEDEELRSTIVFLQSVVPTRMWSVRLSAYLLAALSFASVFAGYFSSIATNSPPGNPLQADGPSTSRSDAP